MSTPAPLRSVTVGDVEVTFLLDELVAAEVIVGCGHFPGSTFGRVDRDGRWHPSEGDR